MDSTNKIQNKTFENDELHTEKVWTLFTSISENKIQPKLNTTQNYNTIILGLISGNGAKS